MPNQIFVRNRLLSMYRSFLWTSLLAFLLAAFNSAVSAQQPIEPKASQPDLSNVNDILEGRRMLLQVDDLVISAQNAITNSVTYYGELSTDSALVMQPGSLGYFNYGPLPEYSTVSGRFFNTAKDSVVKLDTIHSLDRDSAELSVIGPGTTFFSSPFSWSSGKMAVADFNQDGFDDIVLLGSSKRKDAGQGAIVTAENVDSGDQRLKFGPSSACCNNTVAAVAVGDFNGDGQPDVAALQFNGDVAFLAVYQVDPKTLSLSIAASSVVHESSTRGLENPETQLSLASGRFTSESHDQLVITFPDVRGQQIIQVIDFAPASLQLVFKTAFATGSYPRTNGRLGVKTGRFNFNSNYDQIVSFFAWTGDPRPLDQNTKYLSILTADPVTLNLTRKDLYSFSADDCALDFAVGNFDHQSPNPLKPDEKQINFNQQIALLYGACGFGRKAVKVLNVSPDLFKLSLASSNELSQARFNRSTDTRLVASDLQGRSKVLGAPTKIVIEESMQPSVTVAMPPMHVDYVPKIGAKMPNLLNVSFDPEGFYTSYQTEDSSSNQASSTFDTSWTFGTMLSIGASLEYGDVDKGNGLRGTVEATAAQDLKGDTERSHGTYEKYFFNISQVTGFSDQVWLTSSRFNVYSYPVIGQTVCPAAKPNCPDSEKVPLTILFSAPDETSLATMAGAAVPWYQPPWEYGNVLSYPASYSQLRKIVPDIKKLSQNVEWATDASVLTTSTIWENGSGADQSVSSSENNTFGLDTSFAGAGGLSGVVTLRLDTKLNINGSRALTNLNKSSLNLGKNTGIGVKKPGTFLDPPNYQYSVIPYIFGEVKPASVVDKTDPAPADVQTFGSLRTAFVVNPLNITAGGWWKRTYSSAPDIALNHPSRWSLTGDKSTADNCRPTCVALSEAFPDDPWVSSFHSMRGFFITNALSPGQGPQLGKATAGDKLQLEARVYNYSLKPMPVGSKVHARFYLQPWDTGSEKPAGASILIGEDELDPIPPFDTTDGAPLNWSKAHVTFDTTPYSNQTFTFWVVAWAQDENGKMIVEIPGHGLTSIPGVLKSLADVRTEAYSNNVGFYKYLFYVIPSTPALTAAGAQATHSFSSISHPRVSSPYTKLGTDVTVSAPLSVVTDATDETIFFYDGDPKANGEIFEMQIAPHVSPDKAFLAEGVYHPRTCGAHDLYIVANQGTHDEVVSTAGRVTVVCSPR